MLNLEKSPRLYTIFFTLHVLLCLIRAGLYRHLSLKKCQKMVGNVLEPVVSHDSNDEAIR